MSSAYEREDVHIGELFFFYEIDVLICRCVAQTEQAGCKRRNCQKKSEGKRSNTSALASGAHSHSHSGQHADESGELHPTCRTLGKCVQE